MIICALMALVSAEQAFARSSQESSEWQLRALHASIEEMQQELKGAKLSLELAEERLFEQGKLLSSLRDEVRHLKQEQTSHATALSQIDQKAGVNEQTLAKLTGQVRKVQTKAAEDAAAVVLANTRMQQIETSVASQMHQLKEVLESMKKMLGDSVVTTSTKSKAAVTPPSGEAIYVVKPGDTLGKIAQQNKTSVAKIRELNQLSSDRIHAGQQLFIPQ